MPDAKKFSKSLLNEIDKGKILGIRCGIEHRFTGIWVVVANDRVFVRTWDNKPAGWYQGFLQNSQGTIDVSGRRISVTAKKVRGERLLDSIDQAYGKKYNTPGSRKYVEGFALSARRANTLELIPNK